MLLFPPIPMPAWLFVIGYGAVELFLGVTGTAGRRRAFRASRRHGDRLRADPVLARQVADEAAADIDAVKTGIGIRDSGSADSRAARSARARRRPERSHRRQSASAPNLASSIPPRCPSPSPTGSTTSNASIRARSSSASIACARSGSGSARRRRRRVVITVGGTNGKGSTVAFLEAMLRADGKRVGAYTSPHLLRYNERVRIDGADVDDAALIDAFERIEARARRYRADLFRIRHARRAAAFRRRRGSMSRVLEVGLGGRLDAVNIIDADAAIVTTVDLDHQDWLGNDRDSIGREKAGIFRARTARDHRRCAIRRAACSTQRARIGARPAHRRARFPRRHRAADDWRWRHAATPSIVLPHPALDAPCQHANAAAAIAALHALRARLGWNPQRDRARRRRTRTSARACSASRARPSSSSTSHTTRRPRARSRPGSRRRQRHGPHVRGVRRAGDKDVRGIVAPLRRRSRRVASCRARARFAARTRRRRAGRTRRGDRPQSTRRMRRRDALAALRRRSRAIASSRSARSSSPPRRWRSRERAAAFRRSRRVQRSALASGSARRR